MIDFSVMEIDIIFSALCRGKPYVNESMKIEDLPESFVSEKAPRTVIALDTNGTLSLIQVTLSTVT